MRTILIHALGLFVIATLFVASMQAMEEVAYSRSMARAGAVAGIAKVGPTKRLAEAAPDLVHFLPAIMVIAGFPRRAWRAESIFERSGDRFASRKCDKPKTLNQIL